MPKLTVSAASVATVGTFESTPQVVGPRKSLVMVLISGDAYFGWTTTPDGAVTASGDADAGIPLVIGEKCAFDAESFRMNQTLRVFSSAGAVINYIENKHP